MCLCADKLSQQGGLTLDLLTKNMLHSPTCSISSKQYHPYTCIHVQVMAAQNFSGSYPYLTFLGRLLHTVPSLCTDVIHSFGM